MKDLLLSRAANVFVLLAALSFSHASLAQGKKSTYSIFKDSVPSGTRWTGDARSIRAGGYTKNSSRYIYVKPAYGNSAITGLSLPIREKPRAGEYRYITFTWVKWGGGQVGLKFSDKDAYTYYAGEGDRITRGIKIDHKAPGHWMVTTRDLWKDFGNFTLTEVSFLCPTARDAGFDVIVLGNSPDAFEGVPGILPTKVGAALTIEDDSISLDESMFVADGEEMEEPRGVQIDWAGQIKAGGIWMYPLYLLAIIAFVITLQRLVTSRESRLAPKKLRKTVNESLSRGDIESALLACDRSPSTLGAALHFIIEHREAGKEAVSQTAGDMATRDIRAHLSRIYPLSVIASVAPLLGLLGTIVGMIEAFGLVALYGDEGGAAILSDSISKALITTAAGLIIAAPSVCLYFIIKNRITKLASSVEVGIEEAIVRLYFLKADKEEERDAPEV